jgi:hypothetical protein
MEAASKSVAMVPTPMNDVAKQALAIAEANVRHLSTMLAN